MTLTDPQPGFQGHTIFEVEYLENGVSQGKRYCSTLRGNRTKHQEWYHVW